MKKRKKLVFDTGEIPHLWAHRTQEEARNRQGNLYFTGDTIYSYGSHFPIARHAPELDSDALTAIRKREAQRSAEKAEQTKRERAEALVRQQELITKWRVGQYSGCLYDVPVMLRIDGDQVVTSRGARFPASHAKRALAFVRKVRESGQAYVRNGHTIHLGPYAIDRIEPDGTVKAGCHVVSWEEIERIAPALDSVPTSASAIDSTSEVQS